MASLNKVQLIGHLGRDPETRHTQAGKPICNFNLATSESWKDRSSGERHEKTEWHRVVIFNEGLAKVAQEYLRKGSQVYIEGALQTRKWTDQSGQEKYTTEVVVQQFGGSLVLLGGKGERSERDDGGASYKAASKGEPGTDFTDDPEIPF